MVVDHIGNLTGLIVGLWMSLVVLDICHWRETKCKDTDMGLKHRRSILLRWPAPASDQPDPSPARIVSVVAAYDRPVIRMGQGILARER